MKHPIGCVIRWRRPELAECEFGVFQIATDSDDRQTGAELKQRPSCGECTDSEELGKAPRLGMATNAVERVASARCKESHDRFSNGCWKNYLINL